MTQLIVNVPIWSHTDPSKNTQKMAIKIGQRLSSTPVTDMQQTARILGQPSQGLDTIQYSMEGTPK
jgi:hypothetical protein